MNVGVSEKVLHKIDVSNIEASNKIDFSKNIEIETNLQELIVFKKSVKYLKYLDLFLKRITDICGAIVGITFLIPLIVIVKIINVLNKDYGPIFYSQERIGFNGKCFKMYKFRSMVMDADNKLIDLLKNDENARREYQEYKKLTNDPRITKIGNFLRKTSLDEFPQFWNVLKGEMSLVGPRAYMVNEKDDMGFYYQIIIKCKPGVTGLWQVSGRSGLTFKERIKMDINYYENHNFIKDIGLLIKTFFVVLKKDGAE